MRSSYQFTSESVSEGHPDKVSDQISDALVDYFIGKDPEARVACETLVTTQRIVIGGEIRCKPVYDEETFKDTHGWAPGSRDEIASMTYLFNVAAAVSLGCGAWASSTTASAGSAVPRW